MWKLFQRFDNEDLSDEQQQVRRGLLLKTSLLSFVYLLTGLGGPLIGKDVKRCYLSAISAPPHVYFASVTGVSYVEKFSYNKEEITAVIRSNQYPICPFAGIVLNIKFVLFPQSYRHDISFRELAARFGLEGEGSIFGLIDNRYTTIIKKSTYSNLLSISSPGGDVQLYRVENGSYSRVKDNVAKDIGNVNTGSVQNDE